MDVGLQYSLRVMSEDYAVPTRVPLSEPFENNNGTIQNLVHGRFAGAALIHSVAGALRGNHYHQTDWHYSFVLSGEIEYFARPVGSKIVPERYRFKSGEMFFTPPGVEHAMAFPLATSFLTFSRNMRDHESHEADVIRTTLVTTSSVEDGTQNSSESRA